MVLNNKNWIELKLNELTDELNKANKELIFSLTCELSYTICYYMQATLAYSQ